MLTLDDKFSFTEKKFLSTLNNLVVDRVLHLDFENNKEVCAHT